MRMREFRQGQESPVSNGPPVKQLDDEPVGVAVRPPLLTDEDVTVRVRVEHRLYHGPLFPLRSRRPDRVAGVMTALRPGQDGERRLAVGGPPSSAISSARTMARAMAVSNRSFNCPSSQAALAAYWVTTIGAGDVLDIRDSNKLTRSDFSESNATRPCPTTAAAGEASDGSCYRRGPGRPPSSPPARTVPPAAGCGGPR